MTDLRDLLADAVADVEPADRLGQIRARVAAPRRTPWWGVGGVALTVAATVVTVALVARDPAPLPEPDEPPAASPTLSPTPSPTPTVERPRGKTRAVPVYFVGDTPAGERLFREFRQVPVTNPADPALALMGSGDALDPDYRTLWPADWGEWHAGYDGCCGHGSFSIAMPDATWEERPAGMTAQQAVLAVQQLVRTLQGLGGDAPVDFYLPDGRQPGSVLGVPTGDGVTATSGLDQLSLVSISDPTEARVVDGSFSARGVASAFEGDVLLTLSRDGETVWQEPVVADGADDTRLWEWRRRDIDVSGLASGTYELTAAIEGPEGDTWTDTRTVVVE